MIQLNRVQIDQLFTVETTSEAAKFIHDNCSDATWRNLGDRESPAANVEVSPDPINPLIERLVNGMESLIQRELEIEQLTKKDSILPTSVFEAAERYFSIPQGRARNLSITDRRRIAQNLMLMFRGKIGAPTIVVQDKGIGIHPDDMSNTILSLANSSKGKKPYLIGAYGHGGSSSFEWCEYTVIISRKEPCLINGKQDLVGWTIVRRSAEAKARINDYQYLVDKSGKIPSFDPINLGSHDFLHGTYIAHVQMRETGAFGTEPAGLAPWRTLDFRLFDPVLPYLLIEDRAKIIGGDAQHTGMEGYKGGFSRALGGTRGRLEELNNNPEKDRRVEFWNKGYNVQLETGGSVRINYWVIEDTKVDNQTKMRRNEHKERVRFFKDGARLSLRPCAVTFGGQVHTSLTEKIFRDKGLKRVGESTIVHIETDEMGDSFRGFFGSNRGEPKEQSEKELELWIAEALEVHIRELKNIEHNRFEAFMQRTRNQNDIGLRKVLDPMIHEFLKGQITESKENVARRKSEEFKPKQIPTFITFSSVNKLLELTPGESINTIILTNARDDVLSKAQFEISLSNSSVLSANLTSHNNGKWIIRLSAYANAQVNSTCEINATLSTNSWICKTSKPLNVKITLPSLPPPYIGSNPPTIFRIKKQGADLRLQEGKMRVIWIDTNCEDDILTRLVEPAAFEVVKMSSPIIYKGFNQPLRGQIGLVVSIPENTAPLEPGDIEVKLKLADGSCLSDKVTIKIVAQSTRGGEIRTDSYLEIPNYDVVWVCEQTMENAKSWDDMQQQFDQKWNKEDVAGYDVIPELKGDKLYIFINHDFEDFAKERKNWINRNDSWTKRMVDLYDAQIAFQCYQASIGRGDDLSQNDSNLEGHKFYNKGYKEYRAEMVRVGKTILWARKQFGAILQDENLAKLDI